MGKCTCFNCGIEFEKPNSEINRNKKLLRPNFCSRTCVGKHNAKNFLNVKERYNISIHSGNRRDTFSKFRYHLRNIQNRTKIVEVTLDDLKEQWDNQKGICPFTKLQLEISSYSRIKKNPIFSASLDRIDNKKGYVKGNIRWISRAINWMKNEMDDTMVNELIDILKKIPQGQNDGQNVLEE